ncbi:hypothetical protein [Streptomyces sp.]|uniref:hypothetical protein n=1 Tax=Streptomyces sp. TaxID=1931 RepID=UPI002F4212A3
MIRAYINERLEFTGLEVFIANHLDDQPALILQIEHTDGVSTHRWVPYDQGITPAPTLVLPADSGRALLDALTRHYNGAEDTRALRRDYDAERKRVDEQAKVIADIARSLAAKPSTH